MDMILLAYLGDSVYELYIRNYLLEHNTKKIKDIQKLSLNYVSARSQRKILEKLIEKDILTLEELEIVRKGRNVHGGKSKSSDIITYRIATGFECLFGYLYKNKQMDRIDFIINKIMGDS